jgi:hypothetical protein
MKTIEEQKQIENMSRIKTATIGTYHNGHDPKIIDKLNEVLHGFSEFTIVEELFVNYFDDEDINNITEFFKDRFNQNK